MSGEGTASAAQPSLAGFLAARLDDDPGQLSDRELTDRMAALAYAVYREWWRPLRNRQRRGEMRHLMDESDERWEAQKRPVSRPDGEPCSGDPGGAHGEQEGRDGEPRGQHEGGRS